MTDEVTQILLIEDDVGDADFLSELMQLETQAVFNLEWTQTLRKGLDRLSQGVFDVVLLDLGLPDCRGLETLRRFRQAFPEVPVVVLTGYDDEPTAVEAVKILLARERVYPVPCYHYFDPYIMKFKRGRTPMGNKNPIQRLKIRIMLSLAKKNGRGF